MDEPAFTANKYFQTGYSGNASRRLIFCLLTIPAMMLLSLPVPAQQGNKDKASGARQHAQQKIEALKVAYLTRQLNLSPEEAQKFWPVYDQYQKDLRQLNRARKGNQLNKKDLTKASDQQIEQSLNKDFGFQEQALQIKKKYRDKFNRVLPPRKVMKLYKAEKDFNMKLIKELRRRQAARSGQRQAAPGHNRPSSK